MKKILSLLSMLMITVMAFATDYTDQLTFKLTVGSNSSEKSLPQGTLTIEKRVDGTYNVTASGCDFSAADFGNWGDISCDGVAGTTNADGLTTIEVSKPEVFANGSVPSGYSLSGQSLLVKFNGTKAYALLEGKLALNAIVGYPFEYTFGTDKGFDGGSTGGGETGGETKEKYIVNFDKTAKSTHSSRVLNSFSLQQTGKEKQTESVSASRAAYEDHTSKKFTVEAGSEVTASFNYTGEWMNGYVYIDHDNDGKFSYNEGQWNQANTDLVAYSFYTTFANPKQNDGNGYNSTGASVTGNARNKVNPPAFTAPTEPGTYRIRFKVDWNCILPGGSNYILSDGGGVWDATLEVVAPAPTVAKTFTYDQDAFVGPNDTKGTANVKVYKMTDDSYTMEITAPVATKVGVITVGTDAKSRTTYKGEVESSVVDGVKYVVNGVVYEEGGAKHLYMTLTHDDDTYIIGENPDAPKVVSTLPFENVAYTTSMGGNGTATVTFTEMSDGTHPMTFVSGDVKANAANLTKGTDAKNRTTYTGTAKNPDNGVEYTVKAIVYGDATAQKLYMTMDNGSSFVVTVGEDPDYVAPEPEIEGTVVEGSKNYAANGSKFEWSNIAINWNKQKLVAVIDLSSCTGTSENILSVGQNIGSWSIGGWHFYYTVALKKMKSDYLATDGAHPVSDPKTGVEPDAVRIELSKAEGCTINGVSYNALYDSSVTGTWQSNTEDFWNLTSVNIGSREGANRSNAVIKYVTVVDLPVTVKDEKTFNEALYMVQGTTPLKIADSKVVVKEMSDETINMSLTYTIGDSNVEYTSTELTKGTDAKGRTTYTGKVAKDAMTFDVAGVVYEKDNVSRLYMTMTATNMNIVVGENPDTEVQKPVVYKNTLKVVRGTNTQTYENAEVSVLAKGEGMYEVTLPKFSDMDNVPGEWGPITFQATGAEESGKVVLTATDQEFTLTNTGWKNDVVKVSMKGEIESEMLKATFNVNHSSMSGYNYTLYYGVEAPEVVTELSNKTYKSNLRIADQTSEDENAYLFQTDEATVNIIKYSDKTYKITLKQITLNSKTSDLVFTGNAVESEVDPGEGGAVATEGTMVQATADAETENFLGGAVNAQFMWQDVSATEIRMSFVLEGTKLSLGGEFNYEKTPEPPVEPTFPMENYQADGKGFAVSTDIDWSKQKFQAIIDATKCNAANTEDIFGFGAEATAWFKNIHVYADKGSYKAYFQPAAGEDNNNTTVTIADQSNITIEVSKAKGLTVDGVVVIAAEQLTGIFDLTTVKFGSGENSQYSNALYKSVKLVDLPNDPETGINAINAEVANGEAQLFTVNGVKLNKLQKGLNIVRTADGKVKKVLVK